MSEERTEPSPAPTVGAAADGVHPPTRMLFLGEDALADGFRMIGFESYPNPTTAEVDRVLRGLRTSRERAFVIVDEAVLSAGSDNLEQVRREGGRIVVVAVPALAGGPPRLASEVAARLATLFGGGRDDAAERETSPSAEPRGQT